MTCAPERIWGTRDRAEYNNFSDIYGNPWWAGLKEIL